MMYWFVFYQSNLLLRWLDTGEYAIPNGAEPPIDVPLGVFVHNISPMKDGIPVKAFRVNDVTDIPDGYSLFALRETYAKLNDEFYAKAGKCAELLYWDENTRFCSTCGAEMEHHTDISKRCKSCGKEVWPLLSTAIIVLIHRQDELLLVRSHTFSGNYFGLVAGFVETGESLEEAVVREISEEVAITVRNIRYVMSQPWPYPCGLMVGFEAEYESGDVVLQQSELADGGWYNIDNLPPLPHKSGVAYKMIEAWKHNKQRTK